MPRFKRTFLLLITILIMIGVCGCMNVEQDYKEPIQNYLKEKYGCNFEVKQVTKEFNGLDGSYLRAVCQSDTNEGSFEVFCYLDENKAGDKITIGEDKYVILDDYVDVIFMNQLKSEIKEQIGSEAFLQCQVTFSDHFVTEEEYKAGMQECLNNSELYSHITIYVAVKDESNLETLREKVENICLAYNAYRQYLYFAVAPSADVPDIQQHFEGNEDTFDQHLNECDLIDRVYFSLIKRDEGITKRSVEKE